MGESCLNTSKAFSLVISKATYINGEYCVPTYHFMRIEFLLSLICMD